MTRLEQLYRFMEEDPSDPFNIYALALEYQKLDVGKALEFYNVLVNNHPEYVPTYYHLGKLYEELGKKEESLNTLETGMAKAKQQNDFKAWRELQAAFQELSFED